MSCRRLGIARTAGALVLLAGLLVLIFWVLPSGLRWYHQRRNQPLTFAIFYPLATLAGVLVTWMIGAPSWRQHLARILWTVGLCVWLFAFFGPYAYALTGQGSRIVLAGFVPAAIILAGGFRAIFARPTLLLLGLAPLVAFNTESFNVKYRLMDAFTALPFLVNVVVCTLVGLLWARVVWIIRSDRNDLRHWSAAVAGVLAWILVGRLFFEFESGKILGCLMAGLFLVGAFEMFRRVGLPLSWSALVGVLVLFATFHFVVNGFALSHVDFRFTANKIIPFERELWRAVQQIAWTVVKYLFILLPVLTVYFIAPPRLALAEQLLQFGWWRQLLVIVSALGLSFFDPRGVNELASEEIYFWTFLNGVLFAFCVLRLAVGRKRIGPQPGLREEPAAVPLVAG